MTTSSIRPGPAPQSSALRPPADRSLDGTDYGLALLSGALGLSLYLCTLAPGLLGGDSGEFQFAAWLGGFVHPTGYPLYLILGYVWTHLLPLHDPAWRMNVFSALWAGVAVGLVYLLAARMIRSVAIPDRSSSSAQRITGLFAALTFAATPTFWSQAIVAEVYTLHSALIAAVLLGLVTWGGQAVGEESHRPLFFTAVVYGLGLAHHRSMLLLAPAIACYLWYNRHRYMKSGLRFGGPARVLLCMLAPLLLYLYIPLRAPLVPYAHLYLSPDRTLQLYQPTIGWFIQHVTGQTFSSAIRLPTDVGRQLASTGRLFLNEITWVGVALALAGLVLLARRSRALLILTGLSFLTIIVFNLIYGIGDIYVFYIPAYLVGVLWMSLGLGLLSELMGGIARAPRARRLLALIPPIVALAFPAWLLVAHYNEIDRSQDNTARTAWEHILAEPIPPNAILVSNDRDEMVPFWYMQLVEKIRTDLAGLFPLIQGTPEWADVGQVIDTARRSGRPVFLIKAMPGLEVKFRMEPAGSLVRISGPAVEKPPETPLALDFGGALQLTGYDLRPSLTEGDGEQLSIILHWQPLQQLGSDYTTFVHLINADGAIAAQSDHVPGGVYYPTRLWKPGELIEDTHTLGLPDDLGQPPYAIEVGLYTGSTDLQHLGKPKRIGFVGKAPADLR